MTHRGGWVLAHALAGELAADFTCGVIPHPSVHLEGMLFKRDANALFGRVQKPLALYNAKVLYNVLCSAVCNLLHRVTGVFLCAML